MGITSPYSLSYFWACQKLIFNEHGKRNAWVHVRLFQAWMRWQSVRMPCRANIQTHRQPQYLDYGNETAQHLESVITPSCVSILYSADKTVTWWARVTSLVTCRWQWHYAKQSMHSLHQIRNTSTMYIPYVTFLWDHLTSMDIRGQQPWQLHTEAFTGRSRRQLQGLLLTRDGCTRLQGFIELFAPEGSKAKLHSHTTFLMNKYMNSPIKLPHFRY